MKKKMLLISLTLLLVMSLVAIGCPPPVVVEPVPPVVVELIDGHLDMVAPYGMVSTAHPLATQVGVDILRRGGNAIDAAVAAAFTLAVVEPAGSGLGGGGFMLIYHAATGEVTSIDYRETAPSLVTADIFLCPEGRLKPREAVSSYLWAGVPGTVAGFALALERYGSISLADAVHRAIYYAETGIPVVGYLYNLIIDSTMMASFNAHPAAAAIFTKNSEPFDYGDILVQKDLAKTLRLIAAEGPDAFYRGSIAEAIATHMAAVGGLITKEDLANFQPIIREAVRGIYRGYEIISMPLSSAGGIQIIQMLNILEGFEVSAMVHNSAEHIHLLAETMKRSFANRRAFMGDIDFVDVPVKGLISKEYAAYLRDGIDLERPAIEVKAGDPAAFENSQTTHLVVKDREGNVVSKTVSIGWGFGLGGLIPGTGILLNNQVHGFRPYLLYPDHPNFIEPGKRPLSSMAPTIIFRDGVPFLAVGSPGAKRIVTAVLQIISNVIDFDMGIQAAINAPRIHNEGQEIQMEDRIPEEVREELKAMGHEISVRGSFDPHFGGAHAILVVDGMMRGGADPRRDGVAIGLDGR
ncbi:MAG TPA: gamma-glutamyltransferase [Candidatus Limnocylindrales bacterium]|nr:gamma-glutamyltransferase [Candidatus Limnocylindrales bacterium]